MDEHIKPSQPWPTTEEAEAEFRELFHGEDEPEWLEFLRYPIVWLENRAHGLGMERVKPPTWVRWWPRMKYQYEEGVFDESK